MPARMAIYFAPPRASGLARFGDTWLGRDVETGARLEPPKVAALSPERLWQLTEAPRHYGFHGTLKAPFRLAEGCDERQLQTALAGFAAGRRAFTIPGLELALLGDFLALVPAMPVAELGALASACVEAFDAFRAPPEAAELARRLAAGLTPRQAALLARWGYPYVLDEFRFHLTLTGAIEDPSERETVRRALAPLVSPLLAEPVVVDAVSLFHQPDRDAPFRLIARHGFGR